jgi:hypothetical protein
LGVTFVLASDAITGVDDEGSGGCAPRLRTPKSVIADADDADIKRKTPSAEWRMIILALLPNVYPIDLAEKRTS